MKTKADICWAIEWCTKCVPGAQPCIDIHEGVLKVPDYIPDEQILKYLEEKKLV